MGLSNIYNIYDVIHRSIKEIIVSNILGHKRYWNIKDIKLSQILDYQRYYTIKDIWTIFIIIKFSEVMTPILDWDRI